MCNLDKFVSGLEVSPEPSDDAVVGPSTYHGTRTVKIRAADDEGVATFQIAAESPHYVLRMDSDKGQFVEFSEFGKPVTVKAPAKDEILDLSRLGG